MVVVVRIVVVGGTGRIGARVVTLLRGQGHDVAAASRSTGVDALSGTGLAEALSGAEVLVDVTNPRAPAPASPMELFTVGTSNLVDAALRAGIGHYVVLSIVGIDRVPDSTYYRAKVVQEREVTASSLPSSIVRATQFVEFTDAIVDSMTDGREVRVPDALIQPIPADEVATTLARVATGSPTDTILEIAGPSILTFEQMAREVLTQRGDPTLRVVVDASARYFGAQLASRSLIPQPS